MDGCTALRRVRRDRPYSKTKVPLRPLLVRIVKSGRLSALSAQLQRKTRWNSEKAPKIGDSVGALGYPLAENMPLSIRGRLRFAGGFISHVGTSQFPGERAEFNAFELDTMFIPGISGGPVFSPDGRIFALTHGTMTLGGGLIGLSVAVGITGLLPLMRDSLTAIKTLLNQKTPPKSSEASA